MNDCVGNRLQMLEWMRAIGVLECGAGLWPMVLFGLDACGAGRELRPCVDVDVGCSEHCNLELVCADVPEAQVQMVKGDHLVGLGREALGLLLSSQWAQIDNEHVAHGLGDHQWE